MLIKDWLEQSRGIITGTCILDLQYILINLNNARKSVKKIFWEENSQNWEYKTLFY